MEEKNRAWKTVSSKYLFRRPWLTVRCEDMLLPNGNHIPEYYILEYPDWVNIMCVIDEACSSCVQINYEITNLCRGCVARSCYMNCPKDAIRFKKNGQAMIDHDTCVSCGICHKSCPIEVLNCPKIDGAMMANIFSPLRMRCNTSNVCEISKIAPNGQAFMHFPQ